MTVDELMTILEEFHRDTEILICLNNKAYHLEKLAKTADQNETNSSDQEKLLITIGKRAPLEEPLLRLCFGDLD
ncbi:MAG: hypothetical protein HWE34_02065 [Methylocystaceae bacterium]|nr:hypothetical protein [Methylocystaceae bacterium]